MLTGKTHKSMGIKKLALWIQISSGSNKPIYAQIVAQISQAIARGELSPGDKLPAVRKLAGELIINPNTVARAYTLLEQQGLLRTKTGAGTFVTDPKLRHKDVGQIHILAERMDNIIKQSLNLGFSREEIEGLLQRRLEKFIPKSKKTDDGDSDNE